MTFELKLKDALPKMIAAYNEKRLSVQNGAMRCNYRYDEPGVVCIIGACLPDWVVEGTRSNGVPYNCTSYDRLIDEIQIKVSLEDSEIFSRLQRLHDTACGYACETRARLITDLGNELNNYAAVNGVTERAIV